MLPPYDLELVYAILCMNWLTTLTTYVMFGRVRDKLMRHPTNL